MTDTALYMLQLTLDVEALLRRSRALDVRWDPRQGELDLDYLVHAGLRRLFGDEAPQPFRVLPHPAHPARRLVLGYGRSGASRLLALRQDAPSGRRDIVVDGGVRERAMPRRWEPGRRYRFEVRCCPVIRRSGDGPIDPKTGRPAWRKGSEVDAFVAAGVRDRAASLSREEVYRSWLVERLGEAARVDATSVRLSGFRLAPLVRGLSSRDERGRRRYRRLPRRPIALLQGELEIASPDAFSKVLARGIGRHRAFGFGMLLLRRADGG